MTSRHALLAIWASLFCASSLLAQQGSIDRPNIGPVENGCLPGGEQFRPLGTVSLNIQAPGDETPSDCADALFHAGRGGDRRQWPLKVYHWRPTELHHQSLYFDDQPLERYGQSPLPYAQPFLSGARFFGAFPIIPYKMGVEGPFERIPTLGYYRPGSPAPCTRQRLPWELDAALYEAAAWGGMIWALP